MKAKVIATFHVVGFHYWPKAPEEVSYLQIKHRHLFKIKGEAEVVDHDRELEFHTLGMTMRRALIESYQPHRSMQGFDFGAQSCEHIAAAILSCVLELSACEVWEDDENGSRVER